MLQRTPRIQEEDPIIRPLLRNSPSFYAFIALLLVLVGWSGYLWVIQLTQGLGSTAMRTPVGAAWGAYITNFVFFACMAHGGMAVSAAVRLLKLKQYKPVARMGEVLTAVALMMAGLSIVIDLGRPDRAINMILYWPQRVASSPLSWDMTVIVLYFTLSTSYLWLTMRKDLLRHVGRFANRGRIYRLLLSGYEPEQEYKIERTAWWLSISILILIVMVSGGVIPWIFGLQSGRPGWFSAMAGPYFLTAALATSIAVMIVIAAVLRKIYRWQTIIKPGIFRGLAMVLGVLTHLYIYLTIAEQFTLRYSSPHSELAISEVLLRGEYALVYWLMLILGLAIPALILVIQALYPRLFSYKATIVISVIILAAFWVKRLLIVVPSLLRPLVPFPTGVYHPNWLEWSIIAGILALAILIYTLLLKIFPIVEVEEE
ncbi:NrfD/PsrC family molybdoenzyme membrane anchor subunit [Chloroflexota bacterium]